MRKIYILITLVLFCSVIHAQLIINQGFVNVNDGHVGTMQTFIDGKPVFGSPFFSDEWLHGRITLADGRSYDNYTLKYNVLNQVVMFRQGNDSLESDQLIKEFTLLEPTGQVRFINFLNSKPEKKTVYYKVLFDNAFGMVLESFAKVPADILEDGMNNKQIKYLKTENAFFYAEKKTVKPVRIKSGGSNIVALLNLNAEDEKVLLPYLYDFRLEPDVLRFFNEYFLNIVRKGAH